MNIFHYTQTANEAGNKSIPALVICAGIVAWFVYNQFSKDKALDNTDYIVMAVFIGVLIIIGSNVFKRINSSGTWDISINDKVLEWNAPSGVEKSFLLNLDQISELRVEIDDDLDEDYSIITSDGQDISLNEDSGIDLSEFAEALASQGVAINEIDNSGNRD